MNQDKQQINLSRTMVFYVLSDQKNLGEENAKLVAEATKTRVIIWRMSGYKEQRRKAWKKAFGKKRCTRPVKASGKVQRDA